MFEVPIDDLALMKTHFLLFLSLLIWSCQSPTKTIDRPEKYIPNSASVVLKISSPEHFTSALKNNIVFEQIPLFEPLINTLEELNVAGLKNELFVCYDSKNPQSWTFITTTTDTFSKALLKLPFKAVNTVLIIGAEPDLSKSQEVHFLGDDQFTQLNNPNATFSMVYQPKAKTSNWTSPYQQPLFLDIVVKPNSIEINGITLQNDSNSWYKLFGTNKPQRQHLSAVVPTEASKFSSFTVTDFELFSTQLDSIGNSTSTTPFAIDLFSSISEIGRFNIKENTAIALKSIDIQSTYESLTAYQNELSSFRSVPIFEFNIPDFFKSIFYPLIEIDNINQFVILDDYLVFSNTEDILKLVVSDYLNKNTLGISTVYQNNLKLLSDDMSYQSSINSTTLENELRDLFNIEAAIDIGAFSGASYQLVHDDNVMHFNGVLQAFKSKPSASAVTEEFSLVLENDLLTDPQFVTNHLTKQKDIVVQDKEHQLYLISNSGSIRWKKQLQGPILGPIQQIDLYRNGRLQLAFATPNRVYVIDRNGKNVSPFPLRFKDAITQPLSIFDYDKNRNYRFVVTQNNALLMYDRQGKTVKGFRYKSSQKISKPPQHFRIRSKDYIVFPTANQLKILDRRGNIRVKVKQAIEFSGQPIYLYKGLWTTTNTAGDLVKVNTKGSVSFQELQLRRDHQLYTSSKSLVTLSENQLQIKSNTVELDYGNYTTPKFFYLNDKIYVSTTDLETQKTWLFDSQANVIPKFPIYGNGPIAMDNIDNDRALELVCKADSKSLILYKLNQ